MKSSNTNITSCILFFLFLCNSSFSQVNFEWASSFGGTNSDWGTSTVDPSGNVYTTGNFKDTVDFDPGAGTYNLSSNGNSDIFVQKMDASGNFEWAKSFRGSATSLGEGYSITLDGLANVYTIGYFYGTVDFDPGAGIYNLSSNGNSDIFVQKMDANGNFLWAKSFEGDATSNGWGYSITVDTSGNVYTIGYFSGTVDFDPGAGTYNLSSNGVFDVFVQKMDATGNFLWAKSFGGSDNDRGYSITVDASENVYTTGNFEDTVDFDPGAGTTNLSSIDNLDVFVQKMDASGNFLWAKSFGGSDNDRGYSITVDSSGNVYTTGMFQGTVDFDPGAGITSDTSNGSNDIFVQKMDASGNFLWAKSFGGTGSDYGTSITVDGSGNVYTTGTLQGSVDFDPGAGTYNLSSNGDFDVFVQKMDASGNFLWAKSFGGADNDRGSSITVDGSVNVYTTGILQGSVDFDPGAGTYNLNSNGSYDVFVQKMSQDGVSIEKTQSIDGFEAVLIPNPNTGHATLQLDGLNDYNDIDLTIYDMSGRQLMMINNASSQQIPITVDGFDQGIYLIQIQQRGINIGVLKMVVR